MSHRAPLALAALALAALVVLPGCEVQGLVVVTSVAQAVAMIASLATLYLILIIARQRRLLRAMAPGDEAAIAAALRTAISSGRAAVYIYDESGVCLWSDVGAHFPLAWRPGALVGLDLREAIPKGPEGDDARRAYEAVLADHRPAHYLRRDTGPAGAAAWLQFAHAPTATGGGVCLVQDVTTHVLRAEAAERQAAIEHDRAARAEEAAVHAGRAQAAIARLAEPARLPAP